MRLRTGSAPAVTAQQAAAVLRLAQAKEDASGTATEAAVVHLEAAGFIERTSREAFEQTRRTLDKLNLDVVALDAASRELTKRWCTKWNPWTHLKVFSNAGAEARRAHREQAQVVRELVEAVGSDPAQRTKQLKQLMRHYTDTAFGMLRPTPEGVALGEAMAGLESHVESFSTFASAARGRAGRASQCASGAYRIYQGDSAPGRATAIGYAIAARPSVQAAMARHLKDIHRAARKVTTSEVAATLLGFVHITTGTSLRTLTKYASKLNRKEIDTRAAAFLLPLVVEHGLDPATIALAFHRAKVANEPCNPMTAALLTSIELTRGIGAGEVKRRFDMIAGTTERCRGLAAALLVAASFEGEGALETVQEEFRILEAKTEHDVTAAMLVYTAHRLKKSPYELATAYGLLQRDVSDRSPVLSALLLAEQPKGALTELAAALLVAYSKAGYERLERGEALVSIADATCELADVISGGASDCFSGFACQAVDTGAGFDGAGGGEGGGSGGGDGGGDGGGGCGGGCGS